MRCSRTLLTLAVALILFSSLGCDSRQRGETRTPGSDDHPPADQATGSESLLDESAPPPDESETADQPPEPSAVDRYTEDIEGDGPLMASIETTQGIIDCKLYEEQAPITVANFVGLARGLKAFVDPVTGDFVTGVPYYSDTIFHRVVRNFLIQGGDRTGQGHAGPGYTIPDEFTDELRHDRPGMLSMANIEGGPNTGGSQFFITEIAAPHFDDRHTIFGRCHSLEVVRAISHVPTGTMSRPIDPAPRITSISFYRESPRQSP